MTQKHTQKEQSSMKNVKAYKCTRERERNREKVSLRRHAERCECKRINDEKRSKKHEHLEHI